MIIQNLEAQTPFVTKDGSVIRSILDLANAPVKNQSLAEARLTRNGITQPHHHKLSEEFYFILEGSGEMTVAGESRSVECGDAILIPPGATHFIRAITDLRFLCCCAPPYSHEDTYI